MEDEVQVYVENGIFQGYEWEYYDPFDFSFFDGDSDYPPDYYSFLGEGPSENLVSQYTALGQVPSYPATAYNPAYTEAFGDTIVQNTSGVAFREVTYQIYNANGSVAAGISIGENFSATNWSCTNAPQPTTTTTLCSNPFVVGSNGQYTDFWTYYGGYSGPGGSDCGANVVDHWQWCTPSPPRTFTTLTGWIHTTTSDINGWVNPQNEIPSGFAFGP